MTRFLKSTRGWACLASGVALALLSPVSLATRPADSSPLVFAAGRSQGNYNLLATALANELHKRGRRIQVQETEGSYDNAELLRDGKADLGLLQSDVAYLEHYNRRPFLVLSSVYTEPIHIIAYRGLDLHQISDILLRSDRFVIAVGAPGSGSSAHALAVLDELGLPEQRLQPIQQSVDFAAAGLRNRTIDLAFLTSAVPSKVVQGLARDRIISLLDIDSDIAQRLRRRNPFFVAAEIPYEAYAVSKRNIQTLGTRTLLVSRPDLAAEDVDEVLDALYSVAGRANDQRLPFLQGLTAETAFDGLAIPAHLAARHYHRTHSSRYRRWLRILRHNALLLILLGIVLLTLSRLSRFAYFVHQFVFGRVLLSLIAIWLAGSAAMYLFEHSKNSAFRSFGSSSIAILHYLFSGLESKYPVTAGGNVVAILVLSFGVGIVTLFTATLVTLLVEQALNIKTLRKKPVPFIKLSGHTVIAGWSERTKRIIQQLRSPDIRKQPAVVVIAPLASDTKVEDRASFRGVWVVEGDRLQSETLRRADLGTASCAVVLAGNSPDCGGALSSICCAMEIERLAPSVHTIVETRTSTESEHLARIRADEIVDTESMAERLVSQCVITPGIAEVYSELLSFGLNSQEVYILQVGRHLDGLCFGEVRKRLRCCDVIPLGFWRKGGQPVLNPSRIESKHPLRADKDRLIVLADSLKAMTSFWSRLEQRRSAMREKEHGEGSESQTPPGNGTEVDGRIVTQRRQRATRIGICGWNHEAKAIIRQLQESVSATHQDFRITIIVDPARKGVEAECSRNVRFVFGDPTRSAVLENSGIKNLDSLVVLGARGDVEGERISDHRTLIICLAAKEVNPDIHLIAEVFRSENHEHFQRIPGVEIVSLEDLGEKLLAQAVISPGITSVFLELLTATEDSNEIYIVSIPSRWVGLSFDQIARHIEQGDPPILPLGYRRRHHDGHSVVVLNPRIRKSERQEVVDWRLQPLGGDDALVVMAYEEPNW